MVAATHTPGTNAGEATWQLICRRTGSPWSWHLFGRVGPDGCPGFKGPFPQPVSMSQRSLGAGGAQRQDAPLAPAGDMH